MDYFLTPNWNHSTQHTHNCYFSEIQKIRNSEIHQAPEFWIRNWRPAQFLQSLNLSVAQSTGKGSQSNTDQMKGVAFAKGRGVHSETRPCKSENGGLWLQRALPHTNGSASQSASYLGGFSTVRYVLNAWSCCWTPTNELANLRLFKIMMVCSIHSRRSEASDSYFSIIFSVSIALSSTCKEELERWKTALSRQEENVRAPLYEHRHTQSGS